MTIRDVTNILEEWAPLPYAEDFDNVGLLVGNATSKVTNILVTHDALEHVVQEAIDENCNLIVCFHPILFSGIKRITGANYVEKAIIKAIKNDIAIYALHTALDNVSYGVNYGMAKALDLADTQILIPKKEHIRKLVTYVPHHSLEDIKEVLFKAGAGQIGNYDQCSFGVSGEGTFRASKNANPTIGSIGVQHKEPETQLHVTYEKHHEATILKALFSNHPYEEVAYEITTLQNNLQNVGLGMIGTLKEPISEIDFLKHVKETFKSGGIRHSEFLNKPIKKVAVLGGSGAFGISQAIRSGADIYITADLKYHDYYKAEKRILLADIGHFESERFTKNIIADYLTEKIRNFAVVLSKENTNPINYL
ncbi:Nif3-like dinuclear metal center hexameric protein [uncultured Dokdonia sp.]|uniref:Nif3-like dinuclear metal center hexameric protein n=1 Tax=uncultured Dokdonia sp. TaxID=575653 RepID=UPI00261DE0E4|nr:Nif3-like dinuclear metal center hexameric protein [uncultured Dokdonia sp.]